MQDYGLSPRSGEKKNGIKDYRLRVATSLKIGLRIITLYEAGLITRVRIIAAKRLGMRD